MPGTTDAMVASGLERSTATDNVESVPLTATGGNARKRRRTGRQAPRKRGRPVYYIRKDEIDALRERVRELQAEVRALKATKASSFDGACARMAVIVSGIERNNLMLAGAQSLLASSNLAIMDGTATVPLATHIHLPIDDVTRDETLRALREPTLRAALDYMTERTRFLDLRVEYHQSHCFDYPNGDAANVAFDVIPFGSTYTLRDVYDEFLFWLRNQEITISEKMGTITVRESDDLEDFAYGQSRLLTTILDGVQIESNQAIFTKCEEPTATEPGYAVSAIEFVDQDDLYPYRSSERSRKEVTVVILFVEVPTLSGGRAVSMCRWSFIRFRGPTGGMSPVQQSVVRDNMVSMCDIMPQLMAERLALRRAGSENVVEVDGGW